MPLLVRCEELRAGMKLADAFVFRGRVLVPGQHVLSITEAEILRIKYPGISLRVDDPLLDSIIEFEDDSREREIAGSATRRIAECMHEVQEKYANRAALAGISFSSIRCAAFEVMSHLRNNPVSAALISRNLHADTYLSDHAGNVFYLAMVLGAAVRDYVVRERMRQTISPVLAGPIAMNLAPLGLGAIFMDIGMYPLQHLMTQTAPLGAADREAIRQHPVTGAAMLPKDLPPGVRMIVKTHHENYDGSGYPNRLEGSQLHVFTRIIRICDAYDAATARHVYREAKSPARVLWEMCAGPYRHLYDPVLSKVFMSLIQPFPIGAKLKLEDGRHAVVVRYNRRNPFQPLVVTAFDEAGKRLSNDQLSPPFRVGEGSNCRIASFAGEDMSFINDVSAEDTLPAGYDFEATESFFATAFP